MNIIQLYGLSQVIEAVPCVHTGVPGNRDLA
jgi:hypothetical protein